MKPGLKIVFIYVVIGGGWFAVSSIYMDEFMRWLNFENATTLLISKSLLFVLLSGILIYVLVNRTIKIEEKIGERYKLIFDKIPNCTWVISIEDSKILTANEAALHQYDISEVDFGKKNFGSLFKDYKNISNKDGNPTHVTRNMIMIDKNYDARHVDIFSMPFVYNGIDCIMALAVDHSEIHASLLDNIALNESLKLQNQQLREFSFINSHHIRSHLANILGIVNLTNGKEMLPGDIVKMLKSSAQMLDVEVRKVNDLLMENEFFTEKLNEDLYQVKVIVFVDDDKVQHMINKRILSKINPNLDLIFFESPILALEWLETNRADILLLDINMPEMKGWEFLDLLEEKGINIEVKMLTSSLDPEDVEKSKKFMLVSGFLVKPLKEEVISELLNT